MTEEKGKVITVRVMRSETIRQGDNYVKDSIEFEVDTSPCPTIEEVDATVISMRQRILKLLSPVAPESRNTQKKQVTAQPQTVKESVQAWTRPQPQPMEKPKREASLGVEDVRMKFPEELDALLTFDDAESHIWIKPQGWLGKKDFAKVADIVKKEFGGEYVSAGKDSHFRINKQ